MSPGNMVFLLGGFRHLPKTMWTVFFLQVFIRGGDFVFPFLTLFLTRKLGMSVAGAGMWVMANGVASMLGTLVAGKAGDHFGRKPVLATCIVGTGLLAAACGFLPPSLLIPRVLMVAALFQGAMKPILSATVMDLCPQDLRKEAFSLSYLGINLGAAMGPLCAGLLFETRVSWIFFGYGFALTLALLLVLHGLSGGHPPAEDTDSERPVEGTALQAFLERPALVAFCVLSLFVSFAYAQTVFGLTLYTSELFGARGAVVFGFLKSCNAVVVLATTAFLTRLTRHLSGALTMGLGSGLCAAGFAMLIFRLNLGLLVLAAILWTFGEVLLATNMGAYLAGHTPRNFRGRFQSIRELLASLGRLLSPVAFGALIAGAGIHVSWLATALVILCCAAGFALLHRREKETKSYEPPGDLPWE